MTAPASLMEDMQQLEQALLHQDFQHKPAELERLLAADFMEVSPQGSQTTRSEVLQWLLQKNPEDRWLFTDWQVNEVTPGLRVVRYHAVRCVPASASKGARHLSLWRQHAEGHWQLWFHQSTKVA